MTRREKLQRRLARREEWAEGRADKAESAYNAASDLVRGIPPGQPILVGHHSEGRHRRILDRHDSKMRRAVEHHEMAKRHRGKAESIERQLDRSIFSDDENAIEALEERIAGLEAERSRIKEYNKTARKAAKAGGQTGDLSLLDDRQKAVLLSVAKYTPYNLKPGTPFPSYVLSNLSGNIKRNRDRLGSLKLRCQNEADKD